MWPTSTVRSGRAPTPGCRRRDSTGLADPTDNEEGSRRGVPSFSRQQVLACVLIPDKEPENAMRIHRCTRIDLLPPTLPLLPPFPEYDLMIPLGMKTMPPAMWHD